MMCLQFDFTSAWAEYVCKLLHAFHFLKCFRFFFQGTKLATWDWCHPSLSSKMTVTLKDHLWYSNYSFVFNDNFAGEKMVTFDVTFLTFTWIRIFEDLSGRPKRVEATYSSEGRATLYQVTLNKPIDPRSVCAETLLIRRDSRHLLPWLF